MRNLVKTIGLSIALAMVGSAATIVQFNGTVGGQTASATVTGNFAANTLTLTINGLVSNPTSVIQGVSGIEFTILGGLTGTLSSVSGQLINVAGNGTWSTTAGTPDWVQTPPSFLTSALGASGPDHVLIGGPNASSIYSNANGSIAGNGPHNPFVQNQITLVYNIAGLTANSSFESMTLLFGTGPTRVNVDPLIPGNANGIPEPSTYGLLGSSLIGLALLKRRC